MCLGIATLLTLAICSDLQRFAAIRSPSPVLRLLQHMLAALATALAAAAARPAALGRRTALCASVAGAVRPRLALALPVELKTELAIFDATLRQPLPAIDTRRQAEKLRDAQLNLDPRALAGKLAPGTPIPGPKATLKQAGVDVDAIGGETLGAARSARARGRRGAGEGPDDHARGGGEAAARGSREDCGRAREVTPSKALYTEHVRSIVLIWGDEANAGVRRLTLLARDLEVRFRAEDGRRAKPTAAAGGSGGGGGRYLGRDTRTLGSLRIRRYSDGRRPGDYKERDERGGKPSARYQISLRGLSSTIHDPRSCS